jgi:predicted dehydrogenase
MENNPTRRDFIRTTAAAAIAAAALPVWAQDDKKITVAFVGVAHIHTPGYLDEVKKHANVQVKYVWDHDPKRAGRSAEKVGAQAVPDVKTIWSDPEISAVIILSETNLHYELVLAAAAAGKNLFVEKPLGITADESRKMAAAIEKGDLIFTTG